MRIRPIVNAAGRIEAFESGDERYTIEELQTPAWLVEVDKWPSSRGSGFVAGHRLPLISLMVPAGQSEGNVLIAELISRQTAPVGGIRMVKTFIRFVRRDGIWVIETGGREISALQAISTTPGDRIETVELRPLMTETDPNATVRSTEGPSSGEPRRSDRSDRPHTGPEGHSGDAATAPGARSAHP